MTAPSPLRPPDSTAAGRGPTDARPSDAEERWRAECRQCGAVTDHSDREAAHLAVLEHIADSGHTGETTVSGQFEVWRSAADNRVSVRAHRLTISIGVCADGTYALPSHTY